MYALPIAHEKDCERNILEENIPRFLDPKLKHYLPDPFHLLDMDRAIERVILSTKNQEKICVFGDYDVDGATSSALLRKVLQELGIATTLYIPDRLNEGYGPNDSAFKKIKEEGVKLIITVDCGASAYHSLETAAKLQLDVIVIDHHLTDEILPKAVAIVNPKRLDQVSEYGYLAAVGVVYLFVIALVKTLRNQGYFINRTEPDLLQYLDLVALGTVCDVMPLIGLNRAFVVQGLKVLKKRQNTGLRVLCDTAGLDQEPTCYHLGFVLGPRINASGRIGTSCLGSKLLSISSEVTATAIAQELEENNTQRKIIEDAIYVKALQIAEFQKNDNIIFIVGDNWHIGVIGIVAGKLKEIFEKPVVVVSVTKNIGKASCRSILGVDLGAKIILAKMSGLLIDGGGHAMAAGFTVQKDKILELQNFLNNALDKEIKNTRQNNYLEYDAELGLNGLTLNLMDDIQKLEPFGVSNPGVLLKVINLRLIKAKIVKQKHISCCFVPTKDINRKYVSAIAFNSTHNKLGKFLLSPTTKSMEIIGTPVINYWYQTSTVQLVIRDIII